MVVVWLEHVRGQIGSSHEEGPGCFQIASPVLQDAQVVVGFPVVVV